MIILLVNKCLSYCFATKQNLSSLRLVSHRSITRKQIESLPKIHEKQRDFARDYVNQHYYELEEQDKETEWTNRYLHYKQIVENLERETPEEYLPGARLSGVQSAMIDNRVNLFEADLDRFREDADASIEQARETRLKLLNRIIDMLEWLTVKRYAERYSLTTQVVTNWIARGIIPNDCTMTAPELNDIQSVRNQSYR